MPSPKLKREPSPRTESAGTAARRRRAASTPRIDPRYACFQLRMGPSRLDRHGVFACEPIPAGRKVIEYTGRRLSRRTYMREFAPLFRFRAPKRIYVLALTSTRFIDGA